MTSASSSILVRTTVALALAAAAPLALGAAPCESLKTLALADAQNATDADLSRFAGRGGKLIMLHGWADAAVPPLNSIKYFDSVGARMGATKRAEFARLFMAPGMQHCFAGPGPSFFNGIAAAAQPPDPSNDLSAALEQWVEKAIAPETVRAVKPKNLMAAMVDSTQAGVERSGLLCAYPKVAKWNGKGGAEDSSSYTCVRPGRE